MPGGGPMWRGHQRSISQHCIGNLLGVSRLQGLVLEVIGMVVLILTTTVLMFELSGVDT